MSTGSRKFLFLQKGPLYLVCVSSHVRMPMDALKFVLQRVYRQFLSILTSSIETRLEQRPNYNLKKDLGTSDHVCISNMIRWTFQDMLLFGEGIEPLPLSPAQRNQCVELIRNTKIKDLILGFIMVKHRVVAIVRNKNFKEYGLHGDVVCLINYIMSSESLR